MNNKEIKEFNIGEKNYVLIKKPKTLSGLIKLRVLDLLSVVNIAVFALFPFVDMYLMFKYGFMMVFLFIPWAAANFTLWWLMIALGLMFGIIVEKEDYIA